MVSVAATGGSGGARHPTQAFTGASAWPRAISAVQGAVQGSDCEHRKMSHFVVSIGLGNGQAD